MGKLSDIQIRNWIKSGEHFEQRGDGDGLYMRFRAADKSAGVFAPLAPPLARIHRGLKQAFDPAGVFNPGRLYPDL